jgi:hypothetical protein
MDRCQKALLPVRPRVLSRLFRRRFLESTAHAAGRLGFYGVYAHLTYDKAFRTFLNPLHRART